MIELVIDDKLKPLLDIIGFEKYAASINKTFVKYNEFIVTVGYLNGTRFYTFVIIKDKELINTPFDPFKYNTRFKEDSIYIEYQNISLDDFISFIKEKFKYEFRKHTIGKILK